MKAVSVFAAMVVMVVNVVVVARPLTIFEKPGKFSASGEIDEIVFSKLQANGIARARLCSDGVFLRRVYLDVTGTLPTVGQASAFLQDKDAGKRGKLIDDLLERNEFGDYCAMRWGDLLRIKSEFPINLWPNAVQAYDRWVRTAIKDGMPYDQFVRELLTSSGSNFRVPQVNFYRAVQSKDSVSLAKVVAQTFMGDRMEGWEEEHKAGMAVFFSRVGYKRTAEWKEEIIFFDRSSKVTESGVLPDGAVVEMSAGDDPREVFADWLITPENPWFGRCIVNRIWQQLLGRGIIEPADDVRDDNPASHPKLLGYLEKELVAGEYDLKHIYRIILNSKVYQLSSIAQSDDRNAGELFAHYPLRRLDAEVLIDALCQISGTTEEYMSSIPEPFTWVPEKQRSIVLSDGSVTSSFLDLFGRPARDTGMVSERNNTMTSAQRLHLLNSSHLRTKIEMVRKQGAVRQKIRKNQRQAVNHLYLMILSRYPTAEELAAIKSYAESVRGVRGSDPYTDLVWALVNSSEFLYRH